MTDNRKDGPLVSVIMNCYNSARYLREAIDSVIAQTYPNWEIIFWDNQSTDESAAVFKSYRDERLKYFYAPTHTPLGTARNLALQKANGDWCGILDCDDTWDPEKLMLQLQAAGDDTDIAVVYADYHIISADGQIKKASDKPVKHFEGKVFEEIFTELFTVCWPTVLFNTKLLREAGSFEGYKYLEDYDSLLRIAEKGRFVFVNQKLASYRVHPQQSSVNYQLMLAEKLEITAKWKKTWEDRKTASPHSEALVKQARARAYFVAGINAVHYGDSGAAYFKQSLKEQYTGMSAIGAALSVLGPRATVFMINIFRKLTGRGDYF